MSTENPNAVGITAVAVTRKNDEGELYLDWLLEGGICELEHPGVVLLATDGASLTGDDGHGEVYTLPQPASGWVQDAWRPMESAPKDGTLLRLLVEFDDCAIDDGEGPFATVGQNFLDTTGEDTWQLVGWNWEQDCFVDGVGRPVGWMPMLAGATPPMQAERRHELEPDCECLESDGCPTELAVLKRFWREHNANSSHPSEQDERTPCPCCARSAPANSYEAGFINGSGMCITCHAALPPMDIKAAGHMAGVPLLSTAAQVVLAERNRQINAEGYDASHDDMATNGQIAVAAGYYALICGWPHERDISLIQGGRQPQYWPWAAEYWKPSTPRRNLVKAGALILAEIERLDRAAAKAGQQEQ